jgi:hypothetical protein
MSSYSSSAFCSTISYSYELEDGSVLPSFITYSGRNVDISPESQDTDIGEYVVKCIGTIVPFGTFDVTTFTVTVTEFVFEPPALPIIETIAETNTTTEEEGTGFVPEWGVLPKYTPTEDEEPLDIEIKEASEVGFLYIEFNKPMFNFSNPELYQAAFDVIYESDYMNEEEVDDLFVAWEITDIGETVFEIKLNFTDPF